MHPALFYDPIFLEHKPGGAHPDNPRRLEAILNQLQQNTYTYNRPPEASVEWLTRVHAPRYVDKILSIRGRSVSLDGDTHTSAQSVDAALLAAGGACAAVRYVWEHPGETAMNLCRPPGHHATPDRAMGFCLFNNVAVAAAYARQQPGLDAILIVDWDVHHGNGTQDIFYDTDKVFFLSLHQHPLYPGTGQATETGRGAGKGYTMNIPLPPGSGDALWLSKLDEALDAIGARFTPQLVLISAGFDAHRMDPLGGMDVSEEGFYKMTQRVRAFAREHCAGRLVSTLEGGYHPQALAASVVGHLEALSQ
ncbi:MAG: histone deacetylase [Calditrichaeota bacterium]|nr:MAG: histone deacetylase [Calditrichota bacterium]